MTGSRYLGGGDAHITALHRWFGNPALTRILNMLFGTRYTDVYCGFRAFSREAYDRIRPVSPGMEFNLELAINAGLAGLAPGDPDRAGAAQGRVQAAHLPRRVAQPAHDAAVLAEQALPRPRDGLLFGSGMLIHLAVLLGLVRFGGRPAAGVTAVFATIFSVVGFEILSLGLHAKTYSWSRRFDPHNGALARFYGRFKLEAGLLLGGGLVAGGVAILGGIVVQWLRSDMLPLPHPSGRPSRRRSSSWASARCSPRSSSPRCR